MGVSNPHLPRYNYTCVIYGWDTVCGLGSAWEERMGISQLEFRADQPFYKVLGDDQTERYVAQGEGGRYEAEGEGGHWTRDLQLCCVCTGHVTYSTHCVARQKI